MDMYGISPGSWSGDWKEDTMDMAKLGVSALAGAAVAKVVVEKGTDLLPVGTVKDIGKYILPLAPIAIGVVIHSKYKADAPIAAPGIAAGMVAVGLGKLIGLALDAAGNPGGAKAYVPFAGLGYTYDSPLMGLGYSYGAGVDAYMNGAPTQVQSLMGMPVQVQSLSGLGSTIVGSGAPMSAALM